MTFKDYVGSGSDGIIGAINTVVVPIIFVLAFAVFVWGVVNAFFFNGDDQEKRAEGRQFIMWGIVGIVVLFSVWSLLDMLLSTLGVAPRVP